MKRTDVNCDPASEWVTRPTRRPARREWRAISNASRTMSVRMCDATRQPDDHPGEGIGDEADIGHPGSRRHIGEVGDPQAIGLGGTEVALDEVGRAAGLGIGAGGEDPFAAAADAANPQLSA